MSIQISKLKLKNERDKVHFDMTSKSRSWKQTHAHYKKAFLPVMIGEEFPVNVAPISRKHLQL
jgi:hypothetical protein